MKYKCIHSASRVDYLHFRLGLAESLVGSFRSRQRAGSQRSVEHLEQNRLNNALGHWPEHAGVRRLCVLCAKYRQVATSYD